MNTTFTGACAAVSPLTNASSRPMVSRDLADSSWSSSRAAASIRSLQISYCWPGVSGPHSRSNAAGHSLRAPASKSAASPRWTRAVRPAAGRSWPVTFPRASMTRARSLVNSTPPPPGNRETPTRSPGANRLSRPSAERSTARLAPNRRLASSATIRSSRPEFERVLVVVPGSRGPSGPEALFAVREFTNWTDWSGRERPATETEKSAAVKSVTGRPLSSTTVTSTRTMSARALKRGANGSAAAADCAAAGVTAHARRQVLARSRPMVARRRVTAWARNNPGGPARDDAYPEPRPPTGARRHLSSRWWTRIRSSTDG